MVQGTLVDILEHIEYDLTVFDVSCSPDFVRSQN